MSGKVSKTARASAGLQVREKKVIPDEVYIKNLRNDLDSGLYVAQEGARALLRAYDALSVAAAERAAEIAHLRNTLDEAMARVMQLKEEKDLALADASQLADTLVGAEEALRNKVIENEALYKNNLALSAELDAALKQIITLSEELVVAQAGIEESNHNTAEIAAALEASVEGCACDGVIHEASCVLSRRSDG